MCDGREAYGTCDMQGYACSTINYLCSSNDIKRVADFFFLKEATPLFESDLRRSYRSHMSPGIAGRDPELIFVT